MIAGCDMGFKPDGAVEGVGLLDLLSFMIFGPMGVMQQDVDAIEGAHEEG